jgi:hypothetical protein
MNCLFGWRVFLLLLKKHKIDPLSSGYKVFKIEIAFLEIINLFKTNFWCHKWDMEFDP